jgi:putative hydrolase of the HAD superfamily
MRSIKAILDNLEHLDVIPTGIEPQLQKLDIQAFIFDIYGTLLISASGDIDKTSMSSSNLMEAFKAGNISINPEFSVQQIIPRLLNEFRNAIISVVAERKSDRVPYPEIDIIEVWSQVLYRAENKGWITLNNDSNIRDLTYVFELLSNKIFPMPGMKEIIDELDTRGFPLGIVSNAQFYTPFFMNYLLHGRLTESYHIPPFDRDLTVYSFEERKGKPDKSLYEKLVPVLKDKYQIKPENAIFIGNDMRNDVFPAKAVGFKTALFAGDMRSLKLRKDIPKIAAIKPDIIITNLKQLIEIA